jgi:hypothetical protein
MTAPPRRRAPNCYHPRMPACALCENVQAAGETCDLCGHPFPAGDRTPVPVEPLEGLEATMLPPAPGAGESLPEERLPELEATTLDPVQVVVEAMEGFMPTEAEGNPDDLPADPVAGPTCRYCQNPAPAGEAFCVHCGMRLPTVSSSGASSALAVRLCSECSTPVKGPSCPGCGARVSR